MSKVKSFIVLSKAWYGEVNLVGMDYVDEVHFGVYDEEGCESAEASVKWYELNSIACPRIEVFSDAWCLFNECNDFFEMLNHNNGKDLTVEDIAKLLKACGFIDKTPIERK